MNARTRSEDDVPLSKPVRIFGRDIATITCFRNSFICGICCGVAGGLACFLVTSKTLFSTHIGFASIWIGVFGYWFPCRYKYESRTLQFEAKKAEIRKQRQMMYSVENQNSDQEK